MHEMTGIYIFPPSNFRCPQKLGESLLNGR